MRSRAERRRTCRAEPLARGLVVLAAGLALLAGSCSSDGDPQTVEPSDATDALAGPDPIDLQGPDSPLAFPAYSDPGTPIFVALGQRFALALEVDPASGARWRVTSPPDEAVLAPLGTELRDEPEDGPDEGDGEGGSEPTGDGGSEATGDGGEVDGRTVALVTFVAAGEGTTAIEVRLVGADGWPLPDQEPLVFFVTVTLSGEPPPPPEPDAEGNLEGEGGGEGDLEGEDEGAGPPGG
jgi:hypothetical protein